MNRLGLLPYTIHLGGKILQQQERMEVGDNDTLPDGQRTFLFAQKADHHHA